MSIPWQQKIFSVSIRKKEKWRWVKPVLTHLITKNSRCLDIGSGVGTLSMLQEKLGGTWEFTETDEAAAKETRSVVMGPIHVVDIFSPTLPTATYDLITMFDVIEHVPDPLRFISRTEELLSPGGHLILTTPADDGTYYFWRRLAEKVFGITKEAHGHVVEGFSEQQLRTLATQARFEVVEATQFCFAFTEMVELLYNGAYIMKNRAAQKTAGYNLALSPASGSDVTRHRVEFLLLRFAYPFLRAISLLDHVIPRKKGYEWGIVLRKS